MVTPQDADTRKHVRMSTHCESTVGRYDDLEAPGALSGKSVFVVKLKGMVTYVARPEGPEECNECEEEAYPLLGFSPCGQPVDIYTQCHCGICLGDIDIGAGDSGDSEL